MSRREQSLVEKVFREKNDQPSGADFLAAWLNSAPRGKLRRVDTISRTSDGIWICCISHIGTMKEGVKGCWRRMGEGPTPDAAMRDAVDKARKG